MSDVLAKKHESLATAKEIMDSLKGMFGQPEWSLRHKEIKYIYTKQMKEGTSVREHVLDMMMHFNIAEIEFNLTILLNELQRFQNLTKGKEKEVEANVSTTKRKFKRGSSSKSKVGPSKLNRKIEKKGKGKTPKQNKEKKTTEKVLGKGFLRARSLSKLELEKWSQLKQWENKSDSFEKFKEYKAEVENESDRPSSSNKVVDKTMNIGQTHHSQELGEPRRSGRVVRLINFIPDDGIEDILTYKQEMNDVDYDQWIKAIDLEMESMYSNSVWTLVNQPNDVKPIGCKWIYKRKRDEAGHLTDIKKWLATQFQMIDLGNAQYVLGIVSRYQSNPRRDNWTTVKNILKYIRRTKDYMLVYGSEDLILTGYTDSDFQTDKDARKSTSDQFSL
ncbi:gag/pol protein [Cucumis melo var. makuwa]|uniref:Gag/pol protein n=1 Tax=Cucumis melo var. makuwa TaxID=1194695 RepID=A0A5A7TJQ3_CUCMM|nr:gag/pol protein [Cucumis melo var. makuwa]TYK17903.1 gag/pol protein [Cucumis melo var. makuwa]